MTDPYGRARPGAAPPKRKLDFAAVCARSVLTLLSFIPDVLVAWVFYWIWWTPFEGNGLDPEGIVPRLAGTVVLFALVWLYQYTLHAQDVPSTRAGVLGLLAVLLGLLWRAWQRTTRAAERPIWKDGER